MIKIMDGNFKTLKQNLSTTKYILSENIALDGAELIPVELGGRLAPHSLTINELGKQLLKAAADGNVEEIRTLMGKGAPFTADWLGTSPLHVAAQNNHIGVCEILLRAGISRDARTKVDRTPLHMAAYEGNVDVVECLLKHGADYDCRDLLAMTPLHWAAQNGHSEVVTTLIRYGATTNVTNKFDLTPSDIALQVKRHDIIEIISMAIRDPLLATQRLTLEMNSNENSNESNMDTILEHDPDAGSEVPIETILLEDDENSIDPDRISAVDAETVQINQSAVTESEQSSTHQIHDDSFSESMKILQQHGITMLPTDDTSILSSVMENGHSVVLTDVGKEVLNSIKIVQPVPVEKQPIKLQQIQLAPKKKKIITITPEEFLAMTNNGSLTLGGTNGNVLKQVNSRIVTLNNKPTLKRIVMKKNKFMPISPTINIPKQQKIETIDLDSILTQLSEAHKLIEDYKIKLILKEAEVEKYKQQLRLLMQEK